MQNTYDVVVSPRGDDAACGDAAHPVRTFARAREIARTLGGKNVNVAFRGGVYPFEERLLDDRDGGKDGFIVRYGNYEGETPVFGGGVSLTRWKAEGGGVYSASVPAGMRNFILSEKGALAHAARFPKREYLRVSHQDIPVGKEGYLTPCDAFGYPDIAELKQISSGDGSPEAFVFPGGPEGEWNWFSKIYPILENDAERRTLRVAREPGTQGEYYIGAGSRFYVQNVRAFLSEPGEYAMDARKGILYYMPHDERSLSSGEISLSANTAALTLRGRSAEQPLKNLVVEGISCCGSGLLLGAVTAENTCGVTLRGLELSASGHGVLAEGSNERLTVEHCNIHNVADTGVNLCGAAGRRASFGHTVRENVIVSVGEIVRHGCNIMLFDCCDSVASHNTVSHSPRYSVSIKGSYPAGWSTMTDEQRRRAEFPSTGGNVVEYNDCSHANTDSQDTGLLEIYAAGRGNVFRGNYVHDSAIHFSFGFGLYIDDYNVDTVVEDNVFYRLGTEGSGQLLAAISAKYLGNAVVNNFVVDCDCYYGILLWDYADDLPEYTLYNRVLKNIVCDSWNKKRDDVYANYLRLNKFLVSDGDLREHMGEYLIECDRNLVFMSEKQRRAGAPALTVRLKEERDIPMREWSGQYGYDQNSADGDPLFCDAAGGDFTFPPNSPAARLGIKPLSVKNCGANKGR